MTYLGGPPLRRYLLVYARHESARASSLSIIPAMTIAVTVISMLVIGWISDRVWRHKPFVISASLLFAASMAAPLAWPTLPALFIQNIVGGLGPAVIWRLIGRC